VLLLGNEELLLYASGRRHLFPEHAAFLLWAGFAMLPEAQLRELDGDAMLERLQHTPETLVIQSRDAYADRIRAALPRLTAHVQEHYRPVRSFGKHTVWLSRRDRAR
jgi:hypothetical protein